MRFIARRYDTGQLACIAIESGRITQVTDVGDRAVLPKSCPWVAPRFMDIQINGFAGQEFSSRDLTPRHVTDIVISQRAFGVTALCPTLTTQSYEVLSHGLRTIAAACEQDQTSRRSVVGIHVEGPFISAEDGPRGAHPLAHCTPPDWDAFQRLQEAAAGRIVIITLSPEYPQAPEFISRATVSGVVVAIGHTSATSEQIRRAVDAGARLSTHLGNGAHRMLRRHPNYIWDQLAEDRLCASLIVDGHHLPPSVVKSFVRAKTPERVILVSDLSGLAGLPPGRYQSSGCELEILSDGRLVIAGQDQLLAGAARPIGVGIANVMRFAGVDLSAAVDMASSHPAALLGKPSSTLNPGDSADLVLFDLPSDIERLAPCLDDYDAGLQIRTTIQQGECVWGEMPSEM